MPLPVSAAEAVIGNDVGNTDENKRGPTAGFTVGTAQTRNNIVNTNRILFFITASLDCVGVTLRSACKRDARQGVRNLDDLGIADDALTL